LRCNNGRERGGSGCDNLRCNNGRERGGSGCDNLRCNNGTILDAILAPPHISSNARGIVMLPGVFNNRSVTMSTIENNNEAGSGSDNLRCRTLITTL
jgi:hypothetical protein